MALKNSSSSQHIKSLIEAGSDAMKNLFYLEFQGGLLEDISQSLKVRVDGFKPPQATQGTNPVNFMTMSLDLPTADISIDKSLSFSFRVDDNYNVYKYLLAQQSATMNGNIGYAINRVPDNSDTDYGFTIHAYAYDRTLGESIDDEANYRKIYSFRYCWIPSMSGLTYNYDSNSVEKLTVNVKFWDYDDPQNLLFS